MSERITRSPALRPRTTSILLTALRPSVTGDVTSLRAAALRYALSQPALSSVVIGPRSAVQLDQLVRDAGKEPPYLSDDSRSALERRLANVGIKP